MFEFIKQRIEKNLIEEIGCLNATMLEVVGHYMICAIEGKYLIHHGINKDYKPSGYTVDTFSSDSSIIGEYSTETKYFTDCASRDINKRYKKIQKDIEHAFSHVSLDKIERIYLICNQEEPASFRADFNKTDIYLKNSNKIIIYDSREMAKTIYQQCIENEKCAIFYKEVFPLFSQMLDDYAYFGRIP